MRAKDSSMASNNSSANAQPTPTGNDGTTRVTHSRGASISSQTTPHRPQVPSGLRQTQLPPSSPEDGRSGHLDEYAPEYEEDGIHPTQHDNTAPEQTNTQVEGEIEEPEEEPTVRSRLLQSEHKYQVQHDCGEYDCNHGTLSPRPRFQRGYGSIASEYDGRAGTGAARSHDGYGGPLPAEPADMDARSYRGDYISARLGDAIAGGVLGKPSSNSMTHWLAKRHGVKHERWMYIFYYIPGVNWIRQYRWSYLIGDLTAALTMASFYIPMSLSYASNLGHVPPINGLYTFVFNPLIYAMLGTCPQMVVGPEAAGSLLTGSVVKEAIKAGTHYENEEQKHAQVAGMVTGLAGAFILGAGLCRLGFLDGVLSRPFLRGFISAIGIVILVDQLIPEMGLDTVARGSQAASHGSSLDKIMFLFRHAHEAHKLTCIVSFTTIAIVMVLREMKRRLQPRMGWVAYLPDRFLVVVLSAIFAWKFDWESQGLALMGDIRSQGKPFKVHFPFDEGNFKHVNDAFSTAFIIALLGFFESSVAAKSLGANSGQVTKRSKDKDGNDVEESDGLRDMPLSANRELVALGVANLFGGLFMALPGFGGYGRSKVNSSTGGKTPMSSVFLSLITIICILFLMPYFYFIPKGVLSAMISVVAYSLIEEAPHDIMFFVRISGYIELFLMFVIFITTFLWNLKIGIAVGIGLSLLRLLRHSTRPRIQILGRVPGTNEFENAELGHNVQMIPHCLIVKIPEPLTFANSGSLKDRLRRLEDHGTVRAHPALPKVRQKEHNQNVIFDIHGVTSMDPAAAQVLFEIVQAYEERGTRVFFCRVPGKKTEVWRLMRVSGIVDMCGGEHNFLRSVEDALRATERESTLQFFDSDLEDGASRYEGIGDPGPAPQVEQDPLNGNREESGRV